MRVAIKFHSFHRIHRSIEKMMPIRFEDSPDCLHPTLKTRAYRSLDVSARVETGVGISPMAGFTGRLIAFRRVDLPFSRCDVDPLPD